MFYDDGYFGTPDLVCTETVNENIIEKYNPFASDNIKIEVITFDFHTNDDCHVLINDNMTPIFIPQGEKIIINENNPRIKKFVIMESGVDYCFRGTYIVDFSTLPK